MLKILSQIEEIEAMYNQEKNAKQKFSISVPRTGYIGYAFSSFAKDIDITKPIEFFIGKLIQQGLLIIFCMLIIILESFAMLKIIIKTLRIFG